MCLGECISGALWWEDLYSIAKEVGFCCPMLVTANHFPLGSEELQKAVGNKLLKLRHEACVQYVSECVGYLCKLSLIIVFLVYLLNVEVLICNLLDYLLNVGVQIYYCLLALVAIKT